MNFKKNSIGYRVLRFIYFTSCVYRNIDRKTKTRKQEGDLLERFLSSAHRNRKQEAELHFRAGGLLSNRESLLLNFYKKHRNENYLEKFEDSGAQYVKVPKSIENDPEKTLFFIKSVLDKFFKLVLIREYFDESLVLLKRRLCWDLKDTIYYPLKIGTQTPRTKQYSAELVEKHRKLMVSLNF